MVKGNFIYCSLHSLIFWGARDPTVENYINCGGGQVYNHYLKSEFKQMQAKRSICLFEDKKKVENHV